MGFLGLGEILTLEGIGPVLRSWHTNRHTESVSLFYFFESSAFLVWEGTEITLDTCFSEGH